MALLTFNRTYQTTLAIGDISLPLHVKRLNKTELEQLDEQFKAHFILPNGWPAAPADTAPEAERIAWMEAQTQRIDAWYAEHKKGQDETIATALDFITLDDDVVSDGGQSVRDGAGLLKIFHGSRETLRAFVRLVLNENKLTDLLAKNSNSPRGSAGGSVTTPAPARGGDKPEPTAASAESSSSASSAPVMDANDSIDGASPSSSGPLPDDEAKRVH